MVEMLKEIADGYERILKQNGFDFAFSPLEKMLYISRGDTCVMCNYNLLSLSMKDDGESYDMFCEEFESTMKFVIVEDGDRLRFEVSKRYVEFELEDENNESSTMKIASAIRFFMTQYMREIIKEKYEEKKKASTRIVDFD